MKKAREKENTKGRVLMVDTERIVPNPAQPRRHFSDDSILRLADSIRVHGMIQPLCVRECDGGVYELIAGERRLRAAKRLGMSAVPCVSVVADSEESAHMAIVENIQREDLNIFEEAEAIGRLLQIHCLTQEKIAAKLSCSQSYVANKLRLLKLTPEERGEILKAGLTERHARALLRIKDPERRVCALRAMVRREMNVAAAEEYVDKLLEAEKGERAREKEAQRTKIILKDVRILYNTIDRAVETVRLSGIDVCTTRRENARDTEIVIKIPKYA